MGEAEDRHQVRDDHEGHDREEEELQVAGEGERAGRLRLKVGTDYDADDPHNRKLLSILGWVQWLPVEERSLV